MPIKLEPQTEESLLASIKRFFLEEFDDEIGDLKARRILEYCVREIGPSVYNQAIADAEARRGGATFISLYTNEKMTEDIALYSSLGYVETERKTVQGYRRVMMRKEL